MSQLKILIEAEFQKRKTKNPKYSLRAFAKVLGLSPASLSRHLRGQQELHPTRANRILKKLLPDPADRQKIILSELGDSRPVPFEQEYENRSGEELATLNQWEYSAIQELLRSRRRFQNPAQIARVLGLRTSDVQTVLQTLEKLGLVEKIGGRLVCANGRFVASSLRHPAAVQRILRGYLERAHATVPSLPPESVHLSGSTFLTTPEKIATCAKMIREFRTHLVRFLETEDGGQTLYRMQVQVFPLEVGKNSLTNSP